MSEWDGVREAVRYLGTDEAPEGWFVDEATMSQAIAAADALDDLGVPPPTVFSHGGDAVVVVWGASSTYVTISDGEAAISRPLRGSGVITADKWFPIPGGLPDLAADLTKDTP